MKTKFNSVVFLIAVSYLIFGILWIILSDKLVESLSNDNNMITKLQTYKGWAFVFVTSILLFFLLYKVFHKLQYEIEKHKNKIKLLNDSENRFRLIFENSGEAILLTQQDGSIEAANPEACKIFNRTEEDICKIGRNGLVDASDPKLLQGLEEKTRTGRFKGEINLIRKDGTIFPSELSSTMYLDLNGDQKTAIVIRDITEHKIAEEKLRQSEEQKGLIIESLPVAIYESPDETETDTAWISNNVESLTGFSASEYIAEKDFWRKRLHPEDKDSVLGAYVSAHTTGNFEMEYRWLCKDGNYKWFYDKSVLITQSGKKEYLGVIVDISEIKQVEESLRIAEGRYRKFFEDDLTGDFISTVEGQILICNLTFVKMFGYDSIEEMLRLNSVKIYPVSKDREDFLNLLRQNRKLILYEEQLVRRDGEIITVLENVIGEFDQNDQLIRLRGYLFDITDRKKMEESLAEQLMYSIALNSISEIIISNNSPDIILDRTTKIIGQTLQTDRSLIYNVSFKKNLASGLCEWLNKSDPGITPTKATYPLNYFIDAANFIKTTRKWLSSHINNFNPNFMNDGSAEILHNQMKIKSLLWFPFSFYQDGYYLLVLNQVRELREWKIEEIDFLDSVSKQVSIALEKLRLLEERKQAVDELKKSEERLRLSLQASKQGLYDFNFQSQQVIVNDEYAVMLEFDPKTFSEKFDSWIERLHPDEKDIAIKSYTEYLSGITDEYKSEFRQRTKNGSWKWILSIGKIVEYNLEGNPVRMIGTFTDISEHINHLNEIEESRKQLRALTKRIEKLREEERTNISREIHDVLGQTLTAIKIDLVSMIKSSARSKSYRSKISDVVKLVEDSIDTVRKISSELRPGILDQLGLLPSIEWQLMEFRKRTNLKTELEITDESISLSKEKAVPVFRVFQEILTNIIRHAEATEVKVKIYREAESIIVCVEDNGKGIDKRSLYDPNSIGLLGMRERIESIGGSLKIVGENGKGTKVFVYIYEK